MAEAASFRKITGLIVRIFIGVGLLFFVLKRVDHEKVWLAVRYSNLSIAFAFFPLIGLTGLIGAVRWRMLLKCQEIDMSLWEAIKLTFLGFFFCIFMPGLTGDVIKGFYAAQHTPHKMRVAVSIVVDRFVGLVAMVIIILGALLTGVSSKMAQKALLIAISTCSLLFEKMAQETALIAVSLLVMFSVLLLMFFKREAWGLDRLAKRLSLRRIKEELVRARGFYMSNKRTLLAALLVSFIPFFGTIFLYYGYGLSLGINQMALADYIFAVPVIGFISAMPVSIMMGLGIGEYVAVWFFGINGVPAPLAAAVSLMVRTSVVVWSLPGGIIALFYRVREARD